MVITPKHILGGLAIVTGAVILLVTMMRPAPSPLPRPARTVPEAPRPEWRPPASTDRLLGPEQLRYCLSEEIRLAGARALPLSADETKRFEVIVADYNERCAEHKYLPRDREAMMKTEIEQRRASLEAEGRAYFGR